MDKYEDRQERLEDRVESVESNVQSSKFKVQFAERIFWIIVTAAIGLLVLALK